MNGNAERLRERKGNGTGMRKESEEKERVGGKGGKGGGRLLGSGKAATWLSYHFPR